MATTSGPLFSGGADLLKKFRALFAGGTAGQVWVKRSGDTEDMGWGQVDSTTGMVASGVTAGSYTSTNLTVNAAGIVTAAANGTGGGGANYATRTFARQTFR